MTELTTWYNVFSQLKTAISNRAKVVEVEQKLPLKRLNFLMCLRVTRSAGPDGSPADVAPAVRTHFAFVARRFGPHTADLGPSATEGVCHLKEIPAGDASAEEGVFPIGVVLSYKLHDYAEPLDWGKRAEVYSRYSLLQFETGESETVSLSLSSLAEAEARGVPETPPRADPHLSLQT